ncbi:MAG: hypothetical protein M1114_00745 [Candidatus Dependentiae bacterium]|nr:hypothetical protein [Candidatus Dependentiae bacterium]
MKIRSLLLAALICIPATNRTDYYYSDENPALVTTAIVGGIAAICYCLYKIIDWCITPTNEQLLQDAERLANRYRITYEQMTASFKWICYSARVTEDALANFASYCYNKGDSVNHIINNANDHLTAVTSKKAELYKRISALKTDKMYQSKYYYITQDLEKAAQQLETIEKDFDIIVLYMNDHKTYLLVWTQTMSTWTYHQNEFNAGLNNISVVLGFCMSHADFVNKKYPLMAYVNKLDDEIRALDRSIGSVRAYPVLHNYANTHLRDLRILRGIVTSSNRYAQEQDMEQKEKAERERQRIMQQQLELQRQQVEAERQQALELQRQNDLKVQELAQQWVAQNQPQQHHIIVDVRQ